jgi:hypothetical protein
MTDPKKKRLGRWKAGESGNPAGRTPGSGQLQKLRDAIAEDVPEILASLVDAAKGGNINAARLILERVLPPLKAIEQAVALQLPVGTLTAKAGALLDAAALGELTPAQAAQLIAAVGTIGKITEFDELNARITQLEQCNATKP